MTTQQKAIDRKLKRTVMICAFVIVGMTAFGYALVPLYNVLCKATGVNGKVALVAAKPSTGKVDMARTITVLFLATNNQNIPWEFHPDQTRITLHPGENKRVAYFAQNNSGHRMTVQAIPSVTPGIAANYLRKTECFCFTQQTFDNDEKHDMPIVFRLDPDLPADINTVTISYTLFDATNFAPATVPTAGHLTG